MNFLPEGWCRLEKMVWAGRLAVPGGIRALLDRMQCCLVGLDHEGGWGFWGSPAVKAPVWALVQSVLGRRL